MYNKDLSGNLASLGITTTVSVTVTGPIHNYILNVHSDVDKARQTDCRHRLHGFSDFLKINSDFRLYTATIYNN